MGSKSCTLKCLWKRMPACSRKRVPGGSEVLTWSPSCTTPCWRGGIRFHTHDVGRWSEWGWDKIRQKKHWGGGTFAIAHSRMCSEWRQQRSPQIPGKFWREIWGIYHSHMFSSGTWTRSVSGKGLNYPGLEIGFPGEAVVKNSGGGNF